MMVMIIIMRFLGTIIDSCTAGTLFMSRQVPCSMTMNLTEISRTSNVGIAGKWIFRVDTTNFSTCHNGM